MLAVVEVFTELPKRVLRGVGVEEVERNKRDHTTSTTTISASRIESVYIIVLFFIKFIVYFVQHRHTMLLAQYHLEGGSSQRNFGKLL